MHEETHALAVKHTGVVKEGKADGQQIPNLLMILE